MNIDNPPINGSMIQNPSQIIFGVNPVRRNPCLTPIFHSSLSIYNDNENTLLTIMQIFMGPFVSFRAHIFVPAPRVCVPPEPLSTSAVASGTEAGAGDMGKSAPTPPPPTHTQNSLWTRWAKVKNVREQNVLTFTSLFYFSRI